jgi:membrane protein DedA with SNARE-associated domain
VELLKDAFEWLIGLAQTLGYPGIVVFMALESSFFPFPSEVVMGPAGVLAERGEMSAAVAVFMGTFGSVIGALFNYWLAVKLGRPFFLRYGRYLLVKEKTFLRAETFFQRHGEIATFVCRLLPGIRQYVSLPAGLARMHLGRFTFFTALGAGLWCTVLVLVGIEAGRLVDSGDLATYMKEESLRILVQYVLPGLAIVVGSYLFWTYRIRANDVEAEAGEPTDSPSASA